MHFDLMTTLKKLGLPDLPLHRFSRASTETPASLKAAKALKLRFSKYALESWAGGIVSGHFRFSNTCRMQSTLHCTVCKLMNATSHCAQGFVKADMRAECPSAGSNALKLA